MTQIERCSGSSFSELTVLGHCNAGKINGMDLCCCAVSMLVFTIMEALSKMNLKNLKSEYRGGWCHIRYDNNSRDSKKAHTAMDTIMGGFELLQKSYPSNITITKKEATQ